MFTGIITETGKVSSIDGSKFGISASPEFIRNLDPGSSVAINGVCLTVVSPPTKNIFVIEVIPETITKTNMSQLNEGDNVNLELPLSPIGKLDGHIVLGHVDGTGEIRSITKDVNSKLVSIQLPKNIATLMAPKGSVAIDGVALTIIDVKDSVITVGIIPYTSAHTTFNEIIVGKSVNVEIDVSSRYAKSSLLTSSLNEQSDNTVAKTATAKLPTEYGDFELSVYKTAKDDMEHVLLRMGDELREPVLTRVHSQCITGDTFHSLKCDCHDQLQRSLEIISENKSGLIVYLNQEGRGIGLTNKIKAYALQEVGLDTVEANIALGLPIDNRDYRVVAEILKDQNISSIDLLTNNPDKVAQLKNLGIKVNKTIPLVIKSHSQNEDYLNTKKNKLGHNLNDIA